MINIHNEVKAEFIEKAISVKKLKRVLQDLEDEDVLYPNKVGNLAVIRNNTYIGYIDFAGETYEQV